MSKRSPWHQKKRSPQPPPPSQPPSEPTSKSPAALAVDTQFADMFKWFSSADATVRRDVLKNFSAAVRTQPDVLMKVLAFLASVSGAQWEHWDKTVGANEQRLVEAFVRSEQWGKMLDAAGPDGQRLLRKILEQRLSTFARSKRASSACSAYAKGKIRSPRLDGSLGIILAAGAAVARVLDDATTEQLLDRARVPDDAEIERRLDGALPALPRWAAWPVLEIAFMYESAPDGDEKTRLGELFPFVRSLLRVEEVLMSPARPLHRALCVAALHSRRRTLSDDDLAAIRHVVTRSIALRDVIVGERDISHVLVRVYQTPSPAPRRGAKGAPRDWVFTMFYVGVRLTYEEEGLGEPTWEDLADLWCCWEIEPTLSTRAVRRLWQDRLKSCRQYFKRINSSRSSS